MTQVAGVDGCRAGWVVALGPPGRPPTSVRVVSRFLDALDGDPAVVAVDIPLGLSEDGPRACDVEARRLLGPRRSCVFPAPPRAVLGASGFAEALTRSRAAVGRGLSLQAWHLVPKIAEVDTAVDTGAEAVVEAHPEVSFARLAGAPVDSPKRTAEGAAARRALLGPLLGAVPSRLAGAAPDDVLDALVLLWTAGRHHHGRSSSLGDGSVDSRGRPRRIVV
jgi:predicted RNase H-like nuclease